MANRAQDHGKELWELPSRYDSILKEKTLSRVGTEDVFAGPMLRASTTLIDATIKDSAEVVAEMKRWLRTGIAPDGTRMMAEETWQWHLDFYQSSTDEEGNKMNVDYYYWHTPYVSHIGKIPLVMMHSQVNMEDGTHFPCDRLRKRTRQSKNLDLKAAKRNEVYDREREALIKETFQQFRQHKLRKRGIMSKIFGDNWKEVSV